ncbi:hypothetical protein FZI91_16135 [Mycobacterium sp. CBMA271]|nr:hypothetical protein [Mycobacteroides sp. CBMA 326]MUM23222.1 hypothetical protein [Mycobacteroides sp. CBMA 271]
MNMYASLFLLALGVILFIWSTRLLPTYLGKGLVLQVAGISAISAGLFFLTDSEYLRYAIGISFAIILLRAIVSACEQYSEVAQQHQ